jgi:hypothetical protein
MSKGLYRACLQQLQMLLAAPERKTPARGKKSR